MEKKYFFLVGIILISAFILYYFYNKSSNVVQVNKIKTPIYIEDHFENIEIKNFIPSDSFKGSKSGYVFKMDDEGLGYYVDKYNV